MSSYRTKPPKGTLLSRGDPLARGLVGAWLLNEGSGSTQYDAAGGPAGNATAAGTVTWTSSPFGKSLLFNGTTGRLVVGDNPAFRTGFMTAIGLFQWTSFSGVQTVLSHNINGPAWSSPFSSWYLRSNSAGTDFQGGTGGGGNFTLGTALVAGSWYLVGLSISASAHTLLTANMQTGFVQSATNGSSGSASYAAGFPMLVGADYSASPAGEFFGGSCAGVWRYGYALSVAQFRRLAADPFRMFRRRRLPVPLHATVATGNRRRRILLAGS